MGHGGAVVIRLEEKPFELDGQRYTLRCNMAVLERIEEAHGDLEGVMALSVRQSSLELLAAMLNEDALIRGLDVEWTPEALKHKISYAMLQELDLVGMMFRAITPTGAASAAPAKEEQPDNSGN